MPTWSDRATRALDNLKELKGVTPRDVTRLQDTVNGYASGATKKMKRDCLLTGKYVVKATVDEDLVIDLELETGKSAL